MTDSGGGGSSMYRNRKLTLGAFRSELYSRGRFCCVAMGMAEGFFSHGRMYVVTCPPAVDPYLAFLCNKLRGKTCPRVEGGSKSAQMGDPQKIFG